MGGQKKIPGLDRVFKYLSVGKSGFLLKLHSYSGSGNPVTKAVKRAAIPLKTISSPIFLRNSGASERPFSMYSTISRFPVVEAAPSLFLAQHSKAPESPVKIRRKIKLYFY